MFFILFLLVQGATGGHAAGQAFDAGLFEVRDAGNVGTNHSHRIRRVHKEAMFTQHHVSVLNGKPEVSVTVHHVRHDVKKSAGFLLAKYDILLRLKYAVLIRLY